jgi:hypothetical protein
LATESAAVCVRGGGSACSSCSSKADKQQSA